MKSLAKGLVVGFALAASASCASARVADTPVHRAASPDAEPDALSGPSALALPVERPASDYPVSDPPRFHVLTKSGPIDVRPWTICAPGYCADGSPDDKHLPDVGALDRIDFGFDLSGWQFRDVTFRELDTRCPRTVVAVAEKTGTRTFRIEPTVPDGRWAVDIFGRGPGGDAVTTVQWTTSTRGPDEPKSERSADCHPDARR